MHKSNFMGSLLGYSCDSILRMGFDRKIFFHDEQCRSHLPLWS